jgi:CheY-like chemotaxis protein
LSFAEFQTPFEIRLWNADFLSDLHIETMSLWHRLHACGLYFLQGLKPHRLKPVLPGIGQFMVLFNLHDSMTVIACGRSGQAIGRAGYFYSPKENWMKQRVLVVDDDPDYRELVQHWLQTEGHEAILAENLEQGFVASANLPLPDVVLLDIHMGKENGLTLVHWVRKQRHLAHIPIAAVTGLTSFKELKSIGEAGCDTCFTKPIDFKALRQYLAGLAVPSVN